MRIHLVSGLGVQKKKGGMKDTSILPLNLQTCTGETQVQEPPPTPTFPVEGGEAHW